MYWLYCIIKGVDSSMYLCICLALFLLCCMLNVRISDLLLLCNLLVYEHFMLDWKGYKVYNDE